MRKRVIAGLVAAGLAVVAGITGAAININFNKDKATITFTQEVEAKITLGEEELKNIETGRGEVGGEVVVEKVNGEEIKTVESIESNGPVTEVHNTTCPEGEECGRGATVDVDITSPQAFVNSTLGKCIDVDGYYGSQCWDLVAAFWLQYTGRTLTTCGTGAAKGAIADGCWQINAGDEFEMVWDKEKVLDGDFSFWSTGTWGHTGMAMGKANNGYVTLLGANQGGAACPGGGAAVNIINLSTRDFIGAFRPKIWVQPEPTPEPTPEPIDTVTVEVKAGDTLGQILVDAGYTGNRLFSDSGLAERVARENKIENRGLIFPGDTITFNKALFNEF